MKKIKVVSIGGYGHSFLVFNEMKGMKNIELVGLSPAFENEDISFFADHEYCQSVKVFDNYKNMIKQTQPDVALVSTRLDKIAETIINVSPSVKNLVCEKPLALSHENLANVKSAIIENNVNLCTMLSMRNEGVFNSAKKVVQSGEIGDVVLVNARKSYKWGQRPEWFGNRDLYGGTIGWIGIHAFDMINYITNRSVEAIAAFHGNYAHPRRKDCEDNCALSFKLDNGGHGTVSVDMLRPHTADTHGDDWIRVVGTLGVVEASFANNTCTVIIEGQKPRKEEILPGRKMFSEFFEKLQKGETEFEPDPGIMLTDICLHARDSADKGILVKMNKPVTTSV